MVLFIRRGYLVGSRDYRFRDAVGTSAERLGAFLRQYYPREAFMPGEILVSKAPRGRGFHGRLAERNGR